MRKYPNLIRNYTPTTSNQLWVSDITCVEMAGRFAYLALVTDAYSDKIVGWELAPSLRACNALAALKMALNSLPEGYSGLIHHSDRGTPYCSASYVNLLTQHKVQISMTESGDPLENAIAARINGILKTEWIYDVKLKSWQETINFVSKQSRRLQPRADCGILTVNVFLTLCFFAAGSTIKSHHKPGKDRVELLSHYPGWIVN